MNKCGSFINTSVRDKLIKSVKFIEMYVQYHEFNHESEETRFAFSVCSQFITGFVILVLFFLLGSNHFYMPFGISLSHPRRLRSLFHSVPLVTVSKLTRAVKNVRESTERAGMEGIWSVHEPVAFTWTCSLVTPASPQANYLLVEQQMSDTVCMEGGCVCEIASRDGFSMQG